MINKIHNSEFRVQSLREEWKKILFKISLIRHDRKSLSIENNNYIVSSIFDKSQNTFFFLFAKLIRRLCSFGLNNLPIATDLETLVDPSHSSKT